jgi:FkbM family methyltransferase
MDIEHNLPQFLGVVAQAIRTIIIVGAWKGDEVASFLEYPNARIFCFEPNPKTFAELKKRYRNFSRVICYPYACAAENGTAALHMTQTGANDSLLAISEKSEFGEVKFESVQTIRLDSIAELQNLPIDLLWADVQGFELEVLKGAAGLLCKTAAMFLEVDNNLYQYKNAVPYAEVASFAEARGFKVAAEGFDQTGKGGNALFLKNIPANFFNLVIVAKERLLPYIKKAYKKRLLLKFPLVSPSLRYIPSGIKTLIKKIL